jgi:aminocarboxymuconate-semialdehyde decarboxylase
MTALTEGDRARSSETPAPPTVDVHAHALLPEVDALVANEDGFARHTQIDRRANGAAALEVSAAMVGARIPQLTQLERRLTDMDAAGIDVQVVSPSPSHYHYWAGPPLARRLASRANESIAELVAQAPDRLSGFGLVPLQHPDLAVEALEHAVTDLGLRGVEISSHAPLDGGGTIELSDERLEPLWRRTVELSAVIFLHPFGCTLGERLDRSYLANIVGQPVENAVALSHLVFAGVLDRHPDLRLLVAHGGGYLPTFLGRSDHGWQVRPDARGCEQPPSSYLRRIHFDSLVHTPEALRHLIDAVGDEQVLLGSDYPFDMGVEDPVDRLEAAGLPGSVTAAVLGGNAERLGLLPSPSLTSAT